MSNQLKKIILAKDWANFKSGKTIYVDSQRATFLQENGFTKGSGKTLKLKTQGSKFSGLKIMKDD